MLKQRRSPQNFHTKLGKYSKGLAYNQAVIGFNQYTDLDAIIDKMCNKISLAHISTAICGLADLLPEIFESIYNARPLM